MRGIRRFAQQWGSLGLLCFLVGILISIAAASYAQQASETERRVERVEQTQTSIGERLARIETRLDAIDYITKAVALVIVGQLTLAVLGLRFRPKTRILERVDYEP